MFKFPKREKLLSKKLIELLFSSGKSFFVGQLKCVYLFVDKDDVNICINVLISASKKTQKNAVDRNLIKRRIREAYRLNKRPFVMSLEKGNKKCLFAIIYNGKQIADFKTIENKIILILQRLEKENETVY